MPTPSLLIVPARFKSGKMYSQIPTSGAGDFTVTRATAATRVNASGFIESVASGIPRLDYFASGGTVGCPALLVEPSGTNGILNSANTTTNWTLGANFTSGAIDVIGVSGNNLTVAVSGTGIGDAAGRIVRFSNNVALASGSTYTLSFLMKKTGAHTIGGFQFFIATGSIAAGFDVSGSFSSGSIANTAPTTNRIRRIEQWGTDVYRCSETFTMTATATGLSLAFAPLASVSSSPNSAVGTSIGFAAPQIELGSVPTSFIPTTTAAVTRNADVVAVSGAVSGSIGQTEGTLYAEVDVRLLNSARTFIGATLNSNTTDFVILAINSSNQFFTRMRNKTGSNVDVVASGVTTTAGIHKLACSYSSGDITFALDGVIIGTNTNANTDFNAALNYLLLGSGAATTSGSGQSGFANDRIRAAALYTTRLTNAELATLTTL